MKSSRELRLSCRIMFCLWGFVWSVFKRERSRVSLEKFDEFSERILVVNEVSHRCEGALVGSAFCEDVYPCVGALVMSAFRLRLRMPSSSVFPCWSMIRKRSDKACKEGDIVICCFDKLAWVCHRWGHLTAVRFENKGVVASMRGVFFTPFFSCSFSISGSCLYKSA